MESPARVWRRHKTLHSYLGRKGTILSATIIRVSPEGFIDQAPYVVVLVKFSEKEIMTGQLVDIHIDNLSCEDLIGRRVETIIRRVQKPVPEGVIQYGVKFCLVD
jgi:uncharacterized OB-fold protein